MTKAKSWGQCGLGLSDWAGSRIFNPIVVKYTRIQGKPVYITCQTGYVTNQVPTRHIMSFLSPTPNVCATKCQMPYDGIRRLLPSAASSKKIILLIRSSNRKRQGNQGIIRLEITSVICHQHGVSQGQLPFLTICMSRYVSVHRSFVVIVQAPSTNI